MIYLKIIKFKNLKIILCHLFLLRNNFRFCNSSSFGQLLEVFKQRAQSLVALPSIFAIANLNIAA